MTRKSGRKVGSLVGTVSAGLLCLLLCVAVYLGSVLLQPDAGGAERPATIITRLQAGDFTDQRMLRDTFGAMLPTLPNVGMEGEARNREYDGGTVRHVVMCFANGAEITAVRPAAAASLLLRQGMNVSARTDVQVMGAPAMLAEGNGAFCAYFELNDTAYAFYMPDTTEEAFMNLAAMLEEVP